MIVFLTFLATIWCPPPPWNEPPTLITPTIQLIPGDLVAQCGEFWVTVLEVYDDHLLLRRSNNNEFQAKRKEFYWVVWGQYAMGPRPAPFYGAN